MLSPQKALWRTAKELKMDQYKKITIWTLFPRPEGVKVLLTVWAHKIKTTGSGTFDKLSVRVCAVDTGMDRDIHSSYSDVMRMSSLKIVVAVCARWLLCLHYKLSPSLRGRTPCYEPTT